MDQLSWLALKQLLLALLLISACSVKDNSQPYDSKILPLGFFVGQTQDSVLLFCKNQNKAKVFFGSGKTLKVTTEFRLDGRDSALTVNFWPIFSKESKSVTGIEMMFSDKRWMAWDTSYRSQTIIKELAVQFRKDGFSNWRKAAQSDGSAKIVANRGLQKITIEPIGVASVKTIILSQL